MNRVLEAYLKGVQMKTEKEREALRLKMEQEAIARAEQIRKENLARQDEQAAYTRQRDEARFKLDEANSKLDATARELEIAERLRKQVETSDTVPTGYVAEAPSEFEYAPGRKGTRTRYRSTNPDLPDFEAVDSKTRAGIDAFKSEEVNAYKLAQNLATITERAQIAAQQEELKQAGRLELEAARAAGRYDLTMDAIKLRNQGALERAKITKAAQGIKEGTIKLSAPDAKSVDMLDKIERSLTRAKQLLDQTGWTYFQEGISGGLSDIGVSLRGGETNPIFAEIGVELGAAHQVYANNSQGASFTSTEKELLASHLATPNHRQTRASAQAKIIKLLNEIPHIRENIYSRYGAEVPARNNPAPNAPAGNSNRPRLVIPGGLQ